MLKILNEKTCLNDVNEINKLGITRFEKYCGNHKQCLDISMLKYESDVYKPIQWNIISNKNNIILCTSDVLESNYLAIKGEIEINCNLHDAIEFLSNINKIKEYNHTIENIELIKQFTDKMCIYKTTSINLYGVKARDFILFNNCYYNKNEDSHYIFSLSVNNDSINKKFKSKKDSVRGEIIITGFYIKKIDNNKCKIIMINHLELNGSIPSIAINNLIHGDTIKVLENIRNILHVK
jgi:hypothetical protein